VLFDKNVPAGTWRYFIKAIDSVGNYSANAIYTDVHVTSDAAFLFVGEHSWIGNDFTLAKMTAYFVEGIGWCVIPDNGEGWHYGYTAEDTAWNADGLGTVPFCLPRSSFGSSVSMVGSAWDLGSIVGGQWSMGGIAVENIKNGDTAGLVFKILLSDAGVSYTEFEGRSALASGRYARIKIVDDSDGDDAAFVIRLLPATLNCYAQEREESGSVSVPAGASQPAQVTLSGSYASYKDIQLTATGSSAVMAVADNITNTGFDVYLFDTAGNKVAGTVRWRFKGV
jgi:hypothetical protein